MRRTAASFVALLSVPLTLHPAFAQTGRTLPQDPAFAGFGNPLVVAAAAKDQLRFPVLTLAKRLRLEVLSETGETVFDSAFARKTCSNGPSRTPRALSFGTVSTGRSSRSKRTVAG